MQGATSKYCIKETDYTLKRLGSIPPAFFENFQAKEFLLWCCHQDVVFKELVWTFATPILEQLESLSIPLSDITRYRHAFDRLPRLGHVRFILDVIYDNTPADGPTDRISRDDATQAIVQFVEEHTRVLRGRLKTVEGAESVSGIYLGNTITGDAQRQIYRLLPPIQQPKTNFNNNWDRLMAHPLATDLAHVEFIWGVTREQWRHAAREGLQILPGCRSLKRLDTLALRKGSFAWAVQEMRRQANSESGSLGGSDDGQRSLDDDDDDATSAIRQVTLPPLEQVVMMGYNSPTDEGDDLAFAFSQTLTRLNIGVSEEPEEVKRSYGLEEDDGTETQAAPTPGLARPRWSWDWHLPLLCHLGLTGEFVMMFQFRMLLRLKYMFMKGSEGLTLPPLIQVLRANFKLVKHFDTFEIGLSEPTAAEGAETGLYPRLEFKKDMKITFHYKLHFQSKEYLLLRDPSILAPPKSALSQLPTECLQIILQLIADRDDIQSLATLLTTNKHLFTATLPYLYSDGFKDFNDGFTRGAEATQRQLFTRLLIKRVPIHDLPKIVSLSFGLNTSETDTNTTDTTFLLD
ncbi:hypothetical protein BGX30_003366 [Mortierella sp. GBA39]|nr:hypothetical protein BGX30_003366 [Mortierella sp. GBA39]